MAAAAMNALHGTYVMRVTLLYCWNPASYDLLASNKFALLLLPGM